MLGSYDLASINMTMAMISFQLNTKVIWFIEDYKLLIEGETWENMTTIWESLYNTIYGFPWGPWWVFLNVYHYILSYCTINHIILYTKSKCSIYWILLVFFKLTFKCYGATHVYQDSQPIQYWICGCRPEG